MEQFTRDELEIIHDTLYQKYRGLTYFALLASVDKKAEYLDIMDKLDLIILKLHSVLFDGIEKEVN